MKRISLKRMSLGMCALSAWLACFSSGLLVETTEYRRFLAPHSVPQQTEAERKSGQVAAPYTGSTPLAFVAATFCFTPTNLAFLTLLAGLVGGSASNIVAENLDDREVRNVAPRRLMYLTETPWSAMMRGFLVYLCVIAGLYFAMDDPFKDPTPSQYMRLAGTLSLLAFVVGYDPTRIEQWLKLVPSPPASRLVNVREDEQGLEVTAAQGPAATALGENAHDGGRTVLSNVDPRKTGEDSRFDDETILSSPNRPR